MRLLSRAFGIFLVVGGAEHLAPVPGPLHARGALPRRRDPGLQVGFAVSALLNYGLNYRLAFHTSTATVPTAPPCPLCDRGPVAGLQLNGAIMHASVHWLSLRYLVAQVTATLLVRFMWEFRRQRAVVVHLTATAGAAGCRRGNTPCLS